MGKIDMQRRKTTYIGYINKNAIAHGFVADGNSEQMHLKAGWTT